MSAAKVYIVGAGPGDPDLLTVKAARLVRSAEVILYDALVNHAILALAQPSATMIDVGKRCGAKRITQREIESLLIEHAGSGRLTLRLKGGDPAIFGRTGEEIEALVAAGIGFEIVPGVTSALAAAAVAGIPLTDRRTSSRLLLTTARRAEGAMEWPDLHASGGTLAIYMPGDDYLQISESLQRAGLDAATPCVVVSHATLPSQRLRSTTIGHLATRPPMPAPSLLIVGPVARAAGDHDAFPTMQDGRSVSSSLSAESPS